MPNLRECFGHFAPTLRFLALKKPGGSSRQILYFIGLFPNLQDLKLFYSVTEEDPESTADADLVPLSVPPLRGQLTLTYLAGERLVKDMIAVFGGLRFRSMDLWRVRCTQLLLRACAETLETLRLYPTDVAGKDSLKRKESVWFSAENGPVSRRFDLSRNRYLRTLETTARSIGNARDAPGFFKTVLSTIAPSLVLNVVITYRGGDLGLHLSGTERLVSVAYTIEPTCSEQFRLFKGMYEVREFQPVLCANVFGFVVDYGVLTLKLAVEGEKVRGGSDHLHYEPLVISETRLPRSRRRDWQMGGYDTSARNYICASAL